MSEWISVEEGLPEDNEIVFIYTPCEYTGGKQVPFKRACGVAIYEERLNGHMGQSGFHFLIPRNYIQGLPAAPTHWMPLPKPPTEEAK